MIALLLLPVALLPLVLVEACKAVRWRALFGPLPPPYSRFLLAHIATLLTNALSPVRAGEVVGVSVLAMRGAGMGPAAVSISLVKVLDALVLALIAASLVGFSPLAGAASTLIASSHVLDVRLVLLVVLVVASCAVAAVILVSKRAVTVGSLMRRTLRSRAFLEPLAQLRNPRTMRKVVVTSALVWALGMLTNAILLAAFGVPPTMDLAARILVSGYLVSLVPAPPAKLGVFEAGVGAALLSGGVPPEQAISIAIALHVLQFVTIGILLAGAVATSRPPRAVLPDLMPTLRSAIPGRASTEGPQPITPP